MFNYLFITNSPDIAVYAESCGVNRIFLDLERLGKIERQGGLDTFISEHTAKDISIVSAALSSAELLVRLNPLNHNSKDEVNFAISQGADIIMLPMFSTLEEVIEFGTYIQGKAKFIPLIETIGASKIINEINDLDCVDELHIGLNDLHLELELKFMFELIANGTIDSLVSGLTKPFGIGGISRIGTGKVDAELVLNEYMRLGASGTILSRDFHLRSSSLDDLKHKIDLKKEVELLEEKRHEILGSTEEEFRDKHTSFCEIVSSIVRGF